MNANSDRSQRAKLPLAVIAIRTIPAIGTEMYGLTWKYCSASETPMNSVDDGQEVEDEQVADAEPAPEPAEPLVDEPGMPDAGDRAEPDHHLLVDDQHRDQQQQGPQQGVPVVLPGLRVGGHAAGVVVADHHDQPGPDDGQERDQLALEPAAFLILIAQPDPAERALDIPEVGVIEHRARPAELRRRGPLCAAGAPVTSARGRLGGWHGRGGSRSRSERRRPALAAGALVARGHRGSP